MQENDSLEIMGVKFSIDPPPTLPPSPPTTPPTMLSVAKEACLKAYCPYSQFPVAAVIETTAGDMFLGVNVENKSYPSSICAETCAVGNMITHTTPADRSVKRVLVYGPHTDPVMPCGGCRQILAEFATSDCEVLACNDTEERRYLLRDLLPDAF